MTYTGERNFKRKLRRETVIEGSTCEREIYRTVISKDSLEKLLL